MHQAYDIHNLMSTGTQQIEAIAVYDGNLLIGTRQGQLMMYSLSKVDNKYELKLMHLNKNFCKKPIQQIEVIPGDKLLLCLSDGVLSTYDISSTSTSSFPLIKTFEESRNASMFALDNKSSPSEINTAVRLCVAVRRKLHLYYGHNRQFKKHMFEFTVPDVPKTMAWGQQYLCVGFKAEYTLFDLSSESTSKPKELFPTSSSEPTISKYSDTCFLLGRDQNSVLVEEVKDDVEIKNTIKWRQAPVHVVWDEPYILGLLENRVIVQTVEPAMHIQTLSDLNHARLLLRCKRGLIFAASVGQVWCISEVDIAKQRQQLLKDKHFHIAIDLMKASDCPEDEKKQTIQSIHMLYAFELFENKEYSQSMKEFLKLNTDPAEVIKLFPELDNAPDGPKLGKLVGKDLETALDALMEYLTYLRANIGKMNVESSEGSSQRNIQQQLELIDTTLLKCYLQTNDAFIAPLLRLNKCRLEEAEKTLLQHGKYSELIILYQTKGQHTKALQLLKDQAKQPDSSLKGYHKTKNYLQQLGADHLNLIFKFSDWILKEHPEEGLKIFTEDKIETENLPRAKILDFLLREHESLVIPYLEHVIHTWNENNPSFHDALITKYREKILDKKASITDEEIMHTKSKLVAFLEESTHYTPERMILHFPNDSMFEERAIILGKLGRHEQALAIYVQILGDVDRAKQYCAKTYASESGRDVFVCLLRLLLKPSTSNTPTTELALPAALQILDEHADKIPPLKALAVLPDSVPLSRLKRFLESALESQLTLKRRTQVMKGLLYAELQQVQELKQYHESQSVLITDYSVCPVCRKRFGNQSAFVRYPNGDIVHYSCRVDK